MELREVRREERQSLCATLRAVGPDAPTLCSDWTVANLAAHLVVSERYLGLPLVVAYPLRTVLPPRARERAMSSLQAVGEQQIRTLSKRPWLWLLERIEAGPPGLYRLPKVAWIRLIEEWVHHEDVRRCNALPERQLSRELSEALWQAGLYLTQLTEFVPARRDIEVVIPDGRSHAFGPSSGVRVAGGPGEILLFLAGRGAHARVELSGDKRAIEQLSLAV